MDGANAEEERNHHRLPAEHDQYLLLREALGPSIAGALSGIPKANIGCWSPSVEEAQRVETAAAVWLTVSAADDADTARLWFVSSNPWLGGETPLDALMTGRWKDVRAAAIAFEQDAWSG